MSGIKVEKRIHEIEYVLSFGDSQRPESYRFTESEMKAFYKELGVVLYEGNPPRIPLRQQP